MGLSGQREVSGELKGWGVLRDSILRMNWLDHTKGGSGPKNTAIWLFPLKILIENYNMAIPWNDEVEDWTKPSDILR